MGQQLTSPIATGGAGVIFEYRVAAILLSRLLRGAHFPVGPQLHVGRVALQQRNDGCLFDDVVVHAEPAEDCSRIQIQVKRNIRLTGQNAEFIKVMEAAVQTCREHPDETSEGSLLLGLAAPPSDELSALAELAEMARAHADDRGLRGLLREGITNRRLRTRFGHVTRSVATAAGTGSADETERLAHRVLTALHVWQVLAGPDERDWRAELDGLSALVPEGRHASDAMERLCGLAQEIGPHGGCVDADQVRRELLSRFGIRLPIPGAAARQQVSRTHVVNNGSGTVIVGEHLVFHGLRIGS